MLEMFRKFCLYVTDDANAKLYIISFFYNFPSNFNIFLVIYCFAEENELFFFSLANIFCLVTPSRNAKSNLERCNVIFQKIYMARIYIFTTSGSHFPLFLMVPRETLLLRPAFLLFFGSGSSGCFLA